jgi:isocitrate dehydrogenase (NAD+)
VDAAVHALVMSPETFDVLLLENLYGDIVSDLAAGLVGGLGVVPGAQHRRDGAVFEAVHGSAPDIAGKDLANPTALLMSAILMLRHLEMAPIADRVEGALLETLRAGIKTPDVGGGGDEGVRARPGGARPGAEPAVILAREEPPDRPPSRSYFSA